MPVSSVTRTVLTVPLATVMSIGSLGHMASKPCGLLMVMDAALGPSALVFWSGEVLAPDVSSAAPDLLHPTRARPAAPSNALRRVN